MRISQNGPGCCTTGLLALCICISFAAQTPDERDFQTLRKQGFELHQRSRFGEAIPLLEHACTLEPGDYFANLLLGIDLLRTDKPTEAVRVLRQPGRDREAAKAVAEARHLSDAFQAHNNEGKPNVDQ
jgi:thioredoxin-like negative regulator of GroEL